MYCSARSHGGDAGVSPPEPQRTCITSLATPRSKINATTLKFSSITKAPPRSPDSTKGASRQWFGFLKGPPAADKRVGPPGLAAATARRWLGGWWRRPIENNGNFGGEEE